MVKWIMYIMHKQELKVSSLRASYSNYRIRRTHESIHELDDHFFEGVSLSPYEKYVIMQFLSNRCPLTKTALSDQLMT